MPKLSRFVLDNLLNSVHKPLEIKNYVGINDKLFNQVSPRLAFDVDAVRSAVNHFNANGLVAQGLLLHAVPNVKQLVIIIGKDKQGCDQGINFMIEGISVIDHAWIDLIEAQNE